MISRTPPPIQIDNNCFQVSCHFNKHLFKERTAAKFGVIMPASLNSAVQKRKAEFTAGRYCARTALMQLGGDSSSVVGVGAHREPVWPKGFTGSITHTEGYAAALVARDHLVRAVGIDSEAWITPESMASVSEQILSAGEPHHNCQHLFESPQHYLTLVFSAKESLFKCLFPLVNRFFDFHDARITVQDSESSRTSGEFRFELLRDLGAGFGAGFNAHGYYTLGADHVHTAILLNAQSRP
jgi:enterobactin synthetase component D